MPIHNKAEFEEIACQINPLINKSLQYLQTLPTEENFSPEVIQYVSLIDGRLSHYVSMIKTLIKNKPNFIIDEDFSFLLFQGYCSTFNPLTTLLACLMQKVDERKSRISDSQYQYYMQKLIQMNKCKVKAIEMILNSFLYNDKRRKKLKRIDEKMKHMQLMVAVTENAETYLRKYDATKYMWTLEDAYFCLGQLYSCLENYRVAQDYYLQSYDYLDKLTVDFKSEFAHQGGKNQRRFETLSTLANVAIAGGDLYAAEQYLEKIMKFKSRIKPVNLSDNLQNLIKKFVKEKKIHKALFWIDLSLDFLNDLIIRHTPDTFFLDEIKRTISNFEKQKPILVGLHQQIKRQHEAHEREVVKHRQKQREQLKREQDKRMQQPAEQAELEAFENNRQLSRTKQSEESLTMHNSHTVDLHDDEDDNSTTKPQKKSPKQKSRTQIKLNHHVALLTNDNSQTEQTTKLVSFTNNNEGPTPPEKLRRLNTRALSSGPFCYLDRQTLFSQYNASEALIKASDAVLERGKIVRKYGEQGVKFCRSETPTTPYKLKFLGNQFGDTRVLGEVVGQVESDENDRTVPVIAFNQLINRAH